MRKLVALLLGAALVAVMSYGVVGSGAKFTDNGTANHSIKIGTLGIKLVPLTGSGAVVSEDGKTVTCTALDVESDAWNSDPCLFDIVRNGSMAPKVTLLIQSGTDGANLAHFGFSVDVAAGTEGDWTGEMAHGGLASPMSWAVTQRELGSTSVLPSRITLSVNSDAGMDNGDMGKNVWVTLSVAAEA